MKLVIKKQTWLSKIFSSNPVPVGKLSSVTLTCKVDEKGNIFNSDAIFLKKIKLKRNQKPE
jgi:hypothetical protein